MVTLKNLDNFFAMKHAAEINEICSPLYAFNISYFNHIRIFNDGSRFSFSNHGEWLECYFQNKFYNIGNFSRNVAALTSTFLLWNNLPADGVLDIARNQFNIDNGFTIIDRNSEFTDLFLFASRRDCIEANNFYINNTTLLKHFITYYFDQSRPLIKKCKADIIVGEAYTRPDQNELTSNKNVQIDNFYKKTPIKKYILNYNNRVVTISPREQQCINLLLKGHAIKEISSILNLTVRTCYFYLNNIKNKFNCNSRSELLKKLRIIHRS